MREAYEMGKGVYAPFLINISQVVPSSSPFQILPDRPFQYSVKPFNLNIFGIFRIIH